MIKVNLLDSITDRSVSVAFVEDKVSSTRTQTFLLALTVMGLLVLGMGYDRRIGFDFLKPGPGWGGGLSIQRSGPPSTGPGTSTTHDRMPHSQPADGSTPVARSLAASQSPVGALQVDAHTQSLKPSWPRSGADGVATGVGGLVLKSTSCISSVVFKPVGLPLV